VGLGRDRHGLGRYCLRRVGVGRGRPGLLWCRLLRRCRRVAGTGGRLAGLLRACGLLRGCRRLAGLVRALGRQALLVVWPGDLLGGRLARVVRTAGLRCGRLARLVWAGRPRGGRLAGLVRGGCLGRRREARLLRAAGTGLRRCRRTAIHAVLGRTAVLAGPPAELARAELTRSRLTRARLAATRLSAGVAAARVRGERRRWRSGRLRRLAGVPHRRWRRRGVPGRSGRVRRGKTGPVDRRRGGRGRHPDRGRRWRHRGRARILVVGPGLGVVRRPRLLATAPLRGTVACRPVDPVRIVNHPGHPHNQRSLAPQA
jgi:hypothetical protein